LQRIGSIIGISSILGHCGVPKSLAANEGQSLRLSVPSTE